MPYFRPSSTFAEFRVRRLPHVVKYLPSLFTLCGAVWLGWLTFSNMMFVYYSWLPTVLVDDRKKSWTEEEVKETFVKFGTDGRDRVAQQALPLCLVVAGGIWGGLQARGRPKPNPPSPNTNEPVV